MEHGSRPRTLDPQRPDKLVRWLATALAAEVVTIRTAELLAGGAVQENWKLTVSVTGGPHAGEHIWVLRTDATARLSVSLDRSAEFAVLEAADAAGVKVAKPIVRGADATVIGAPFLVQAFVPGIAQGRRIVRDPAIDRDGPRLADALGAELANVHRLTPETAPSLSALPLPLKPPAKVLVQQYRSCLDTASEPRPALEYILSWLERHAPERRPLTLVHGDYRTGNYLVSDGALAAILDWEFAHWGDCHEDIGWFCASCWRFGADSKEAGGIADRAAFYAGYNRAAAEPLDARAIPYWEVMALAKWATIAVLQGDRYRTGGETAIELVLTGLMPAEMELDAMDLIARIEREGGRTWP